MDELIKKMLNELNYQKLVCQKLQNYYDGNHTYIQTKDFGDETQPQNRIIVNYPGKVVDFMLGYFLGKPVVYSSNVENNELLKKIEASFKGWQSLHNVKLNKKTRIHGKAYELLYLDANGNLKCTSFSPLEMYVLTDDTVENRVLVAIRLYEKKFSTVQYLDVYTDSKILSYQVDGNKLILIGSKDNIFGICPVFELKNNEESKGDFEKILSLVDAYDLVMSLNTSEIEYFRNAYLSLIGMDGTENEELLKMKTNRILKLPMDAKAEFLTKKLDSEFVQKMLERLEKEIIQQSNIAILSTADVQSNVSGTALKVKLQETENVCSVQEEYMRNLMYNRLQFFVKYLKMKENKEYDWTTIDLTFTRNIPTNTFELSQIVQNLSGKVSNETLISLLPFVNSVDMEINKLNAESAKDLTPEETKKIIEAALASKK